MKKQHFLQARASVLLLSLLLLILDQVSKMIIVYKLPLTYPPTIAFSLFGDFFQIIHVRNPGALFSLGATWSQTFRSVLFKIIPILVLGWIAISISLTPQQRMQFFRLKKEPQEEFDTKSRWALAAILGGGLGNIIDRLFRPEGVVDFLDLKFYGILGMERWPTFNIADMSVVIGLCLLVLYSFLGQKANTK
ncbi:MAG: signal peptidase II [Spirochaetia bacterium]